MAGFIPAMGDLLQARVCCYTNDQIGLNILHYEVTGVGGGGLDLTAIAGGINNALRASYRGWISVDAKWRGVGVRNLMPQQTTEFAYVAGDAVGLVASTNLPTQTSGIITLRTGLAGGEFRGRLYPPFPAASYSDAQGLMTIAASIALAGITGNVLGPMVLTVGPISTTLSLAVRHPNTGDPPVNPAWTLVTGGFTGTKFATQRRRGQLGRPNQLPF